MLTKEEVIDRIEILESGQIQVRQATRIMEDGVKLSESYHRHIVNPGDDFTKEDARVQAICQVVQTKDVVDKCKEEQAKKLPLKEIK